MCNVHSSYKTIMKYAHHLQNIPHTKLYLCNKLKQILFTQVYLLKNCLISIIIRVRKFPERLAMFPLLEPFQNLGKLYLPQTLGTYVCIFRYFINSAVCLYLTINL